MPSGKRNCNRSDVLLVADAFLIGGVAGVTASGTASFFLATLVPPAAKPQSISTR
jgi:hypothetical protein